MVGREELEIAVLRDRQRWTCHWYDPDVNCSYRGDWMLFDKCATAVHAATDFAYTIRFSDMYFDGSIQDGDKIVCVHGHLGDKTLVRVTWWLEKTLRGLSWPVAPTGRSLRKEDQIGLWPEANEWELPRLKWRGELPDLESNEILIIDSVCETHAIPH